MTEQCAANVRATVTPRRCTKRGYIPATVQPTVDIPAPAPAVVCTWHRDEVVPARRADPAACACCGRPL